MLDEKSRIGKLSIVIPLGGVIPELFECLESIKKSSFKSDEILLVDDSPDGNISGEISDYKVIRSTLPGGVSSARNTGAFHSSNELVLFIDSDIVLKKDTIEKILDVFSDDNIDAMVGIQSLDIPFKDFPTQYKNLWMNYTYSNLPVFVPLFYTSCAAIRKKSFLEVGGFDRNYKMPSLEDTVFGRKFTRSGKKIKLCRDIKVIHLKRYNLKDVLLTDLERSSALVKVILRERDMLSRKSEKGTSVPYSFMTGVIFPPFVLLTLILFLIKPLPFFILVILAFSTIMTVFNLKFLSYIKKHKGWGFLLKSLAFLHLDYIFVDIGIVWGVISFLTGRRY